MWLLHIQSDSAVWILSCSPGCISGVFSSLEGSLRCAGCAQYSGSTCQKCSGGFISRSGKCVSCADTSGWVNRGGLTCSQLSTSDCNDVKVKGISSNEACCKCSLACHPTLAALASLRYPTVCSRVCGRKILIGFVIVSMSVLCQFYVFGAWLMSCSGLRQRWSSDPNSVCLRREALGVGWTGALKVSSVNYFPSEVWVSPQTWSKERLLASFPMSHCHWFLRIRIRALWSFGQWTSATRSPWNHIRAQQSATHWMKAGKHWYKNGTGSNLTAIPIARCVCGSVFWKRQGQRIQNRFRNYFLLLRIQDLMATEKLCAEIFRRRELLIQFFMKKLNSHPLWTRYW